MADGKVVIETDLDTSGIEKGTKKTEKSLKSQAASLAAEYKKQGMSASDAFKKAWSEIERNSERSSASVSEQWGVSLEGIKSAASLAVKVVTTAMSAMGAGLTAAGAYAIKVGTDFESGMSTVSAISGAAGDDLEALTEKAKEMGAKTKFSATEASEAFQYMAMAGWKTADMLDGIEGIMNLAAASGENLADVSDIVTDALTAFGLSASDSAHFADVLAKASSSSNTNVGLMGETFKYVAPVAGAMGYSIEDTAVAIGLMANAGIKGSQAGTALRAMLSRLANPTDEVAGAMQELGISISNADGTMKPFNEVLQMLRSSFSNLSDSQKTAYASTIAGQEAMSGLLSIVGASQSDFNSLVASINNADGAAQSMADTMQDNLKGKVTILGSAIEGFGIQVYESFEEPLKSAVDTTTKSVDKIALAYERGGMTAAVKKAGQIFDNLTDSVADSNEVLGGIITPAKNVAKVGLELGEKILPVLADGFSFTAKNVDKLIPILTTSVVALKGYSVAQTADKFLKSLSATTQFLTAAEKANTLQALASSGALTAKQMVVGVLTGKITLATAATTAWNAVLNANPIGLTVVAVGALIAGLATLEVVTTKNAESTEELTSEQRELLEACDEVNASLEESRIAREKSVQSIDQEYDGYESLLSELESITDENGKVKSGYEERAKVITGILSGALGTEISMTDGVIQKYQETISAIKELIVQKKAEALLSSLQSDMAQAYEKTSEALQAYKDAAAIAAEKNTAVVNATKAAADAQDKYDAAVKNGALDSDVYWNSLQKANAELQKATEAQSEAQAKMNASKEELGSLSAEVNNYNALMEAMATGEVAKIEAAMTALVTSYKEYSGEALQTSKDTRQSMYDQASGYAENLKLVQEGAVEVADSVYQDMASAALSSVLEFNKVPGGVAGALEEIGPESSTAIAKALANANLSGKLDGEAKKGVKTFIDGLDGLDADTQAVWSEAWYGALKGLEGFEELADPAKEGVDAFLESLIAALDVHSPSRAVEKIFKQVWPGAGEGLDDGLDDVTNKGSSGVEKILKAMQESDLLDGAKAVGSKIMTFFKNGISDKEAESMDAGKKNADAANKGAASINPYSTGTNFGNVLSAGVGSMKNVLSSAGTTIANYAKNGAGSINPYGTGTAFGNLFSSGISGMKNALTDSGALIASHAKRGAGSINPYNTGTDFGNMFGTGISDMKNTSLNAGALIASSANGGAASINPYSVGSGFTTSFAKGVGSVGMYIEGKKRADAAQNGIKSVSANLSGYNFVQGFINGFGLADVWTAAWNIGKRALSALSKSIKEGSPSKLTRRSGGFFGEGFELGILDEAKSVEKASVQLGNAALKGIDISGLAEKARSVVSLEQANLSTAIKANIEYAINDRYRANNSVGLQPKDLESLANKIVSGFENAQFGFKVGNREFARLVKGVV